LKVDLESEKGRYEDLQAEHLQLQMSTRSSLSESNNLSREIEALKGSRSGGKDTNILTEQIDRDVTRIHKLELEKQKLQAEVEALRADGFAESSERILELERENKRLSMNVKQLEELRAKDQEYGGELETRVGQLRAKVKHQEDVSSALRESEERLRIEKEAEIDQLQRHLEGLRRRQEIGRDEQMAALEQESGKMVKENTLLQATVGKLQHEKDRLERKLAESTAEADSAAEIRSEKEKLNSTLEEMSKELEELRASKEENERRAEEGEKFERECAKLQRTVDKIRTESHQHEIEATR